LLQARGKEALRGPAYHQRLLPAHTQLKYRQAGQGGDADDESHDLAAELLAAEKAHYAKRNGGYLPPADDDAPSGGVKRALESGSGGGGDTQDGEEEDFEAKRRRILEESRDIDADEEEDDDDDDDSDDSEDDEDAELQRELEKIRRERAEKREREEREKAAVEEEARERDIALGNPLLNKPDFNMKRRWDDDVVFKNQARGTDDRGKNKEFINVSLLIGVAGRGLTSVTGSAAVGLPQALHEQVCQVDCYDMGMQCAYMPRDYDTPFFSVQHAS
jgi:protein CWC15